MAIDVGTENLTVQVKDRTWRVEIFTDLGVDPLIRVHREKVWLRDDGTVAQRQHLFVIERNASAIAAQVFRVGNVEVTGAELAGLIAEAADQWQRESMAQTEEDGA